MALPVPGLRVLIVDDASPDGTRRLADELAAGSASRRDMLQRASLHGLSLPYMAPFGEDIS